MKKYISIIFGIIIIALAIVLAIFLIQNKKPKKTKPGKTEKVVFVEKVVNSDIPILITASGRLSAKNKIEIYSEVQGVLNSTTKEFKPGTYYMKDEILLSINSEEVFQNLQSLKSNFLNVLITMMPDLKIEFPNDYDKWQGYLSEFDINKTTPELPVINSDKEKFFLSLRHVFTTFYNVRNLETRLNKHIIKAPFSGVLTEASVTTGTLIRQGQRLGEFIDPGVYELEISINAELGQFLKSGSDVLLSNLEHTKEWNGKIIRINGKVDINSQTMQVFILVNGATLKDGMYLEAALNAVNEKNAYEISRNLIVNGDKVFIVVDSILQLREIIPVFVNENTIVVRGLEDGLKVLSKPVPEAYEGMQVKIYKKK